MVKLLDRSGNWGSLVRLPLVQPPAVADSTFPTLQELAAMGTLYRGGLAAPQPTRLPGGEAHGQTCPKSQPALFSLPNDP